MSLVLASASRARPRLARLAARLAVQLTALLAAAFAPLAQAQVCTPDSFEPNDSCAQIASIAAGVHSGLTLPGGTTDAYRIAVPAAHRLEVRVTPTPSGSSVLAFLRLFVGDGATAPCSSPSAQVASDLIEDSGTTALLSWSAGANNAATFDIVLEGMFGTCVTYELDLRIVPDACAALAPDVFENNDDCANAAPIGLGQLDNLSVAIADPDFFRVTTAPGEVLGVGVQGLGVGENVLVQAWDAAGPCGDPNDAWTSAAVFTPQLRGLYLFNSSASPKDFIVQVRPQPDQAQQLGFCVNYSLVVQSQFDPCGVVSGDAFEPNDVCATAPALTSSQTGLSVSLYDRDWFTLDVPARSTVRVLSTSTQLGVARPLMLHSGCNSTVGEFLMSSHPVYFDQDPRQYLVWTNTSLQNVSTRLIAHSPNGAFPQPFCDVYDLDLQLTLGKPFCLVRRNSTGEGARLDASGSTTPGSGVLNLSVGPLPPNRTGLVIMSRSEIVATPFGNGYLCLSAPIQRHPVTTTGAGTMNVALDWTGASAAIALGDTWSFQAWYRDPAAGGAGTNTSEGLRIEFQ
jgi:hypothetical protein